MVFIMLAVVINMSSIMSRFIKHRNDRLIDDKNAFHRLEWNISKQRISLFDIKIECRSKVKCHDSFFFWLSNTILRLQFLIFILTAISHASNSSNVPSLRIIHALGVKSSARFFTTQRRCSQSIFFSCSSSTWRGKYLSIIPNAWRLEMFEIGIPLLSHGECQCSSSFTHCWLWHHLYLNSLIYDYWFFFFDLIFKRKCWRIKYCSLKQVTAFLRMGNPNSNLVGHTILWFYNGT